MFYGEKMGRKSRVTEVVLKLNRNVKRTSSILNKRLESGRSQGRTLRVVEENDGARASELADILNLSPSTLSEKLQKLEEDGNIRRVRDKTDLRIVHIFITEKGRETLKLRSEGGKKNSPDYTACLSDEETEQFIELCNRLSDSLDSIYLDEKKRREDFRKLQKEFNELDILPFETDDSEVG